MANPYEDFDEPQSASATGLLIPIVTVGVALMIGLLAGGLIGFLVGNQPPETVEVPRELTEDELNAACSSRVDEAVEEAASELEEAQTTVSTLQDDVFAKERQVAELEAEMSRRAVRGRELVAELEAARAELETLREELAAAVEEKDRLFRELRHTEEELADQRVETYVAREDALAFKWATFLGEAQLEVCERGGRRRMGRCRETVEAELPRFRERFEHCIRSGQAIPSILEAPREMEVLPAYGEWLNQDERITKDWYVLLCDPTLPEAEGWEAPALPTRE